MNVGERIAFFRRAKGVTVNKLATLSGVSQSYLRDLELGNTDNPTVDTLSCICTSLGISLKEFFDTGSDMNFSEEPLLQEIYQLSPSQREQLRLFLVSMRGGALHSI
jgi:transcriptional regulator with XRE-family HTH domain